MYNANAPIGIFDSGVGGLTLAKAINDYLPQENVIYFGDTAHMPYGDKNATDINRHVKNIVNFLIKQECKMLLIACNTATAASFHSLQQSLSPCIPIINVVDPVITHLSHYYMHKKIGLIATAFTVQSGIYNRIINIKNCTQLSAVAARLLAPAIEEFGDHDLIKSILEIYLAREELRDIDALLLGCTHYPLVKDKIRNFYKQEIDIIDTVDIVAKEVKSFLIKENILNQQKKGEKQFFISKEHPGFTKTAKFIFKNEPIQIIHQIL